MIIIYPHEGETWVRVKGKTRIFVSTVVQPPPPPLTILLNLYLHHDSHHEDDGGDDDDDDDDDDRMMWRPCQFHANNPHWERIKILPPNIEAGLQQQDIQDDNALMEILTILRILTIQWTVI